MTSAISLKMSVLKPHYWDEAEAAYLNPTFILSFLPEIDLSLFPAFTWELKNHIPQPAWKAR